jgi:ribonuclease HI
LFAGCGCYLWNLLRACPLALDLVQKLNLRRVVLESDSLGVVSQLKQMEKDRSSHGPLVEEIKGMLRSLDDYEVRWARRTANGVAHVLAKEGCGLELNNSLVLCTP